MKTKLSPLTRFFVRVSAVFALAGLFLPTVALGFDFGIRPLNLLGVSFDKKDAGSNLVVFSNTSAITVTDRGSGAGAPNGISSPYPSNITVSGLSGTVSDVNVTLTGLTTARPRDIEVALVGPNGTAIFLMSDTGDLNATSAVNLTFDDSAASAVPNGAGSSIPTGTYRPTDVNQTIAGNDTFPSPGPTTVQSPAPNGTATLASAFNGISPNGTWSLFIIDDSLGGGNSTISGGWSIDVTTAGGTVATTTTITSSLNPSQTTNNVTFTATVTASGNPVTTGTVAFTQNGTGLAGCGAVALNGSGQATCTANAGTIPEGTRTIQAAYSGAVGFGASSGTLSQTITSPTVVTGAQFCNNGGNTITDGGIGAAYPSIINVSNMSGTISRVTVNVNGLTTPRAQDLDLLLVGPGNQALEIMSDVGNTTTVSNVNLVLDDTAGAPLPDGTTLASGTFRPTDVNVIGLNDTYPAPAPAAGSINQAAPSGVATFASVFNTIEPNGQWRLFMLDDGLGGGATSYTGWCVNFQLNRFSTTTNLTTSANPVALNTPLTLTATVTASSPFAELAPGTPTGSVQFFDGATSLGTVPLNGAGVATLTTSTLTAGPHNLTANYLGASVGAGGGGYATNTSNTVNQVVNPPVSANAEISGRVVGANGTGVPRATVILTDQLGNTRTAMTSQFGYYRFTDIPVGESYVVTAMAKAMVFGSRFIQVQDNVLNIDIFETSPPQ